MITNVTAKDLATVPDSGDLRSLSKVQEVVGLFQLLDQGLEAQKMATLLFVARNEGCTMQELGDALNMSQASCSRNVAALSDTHRLKKPGLGLVYKEQDPKEPRRFIMRLTPKGKRLITQIRDIMK